MLTERFVDALAFAARVHGNQMRKCGAGTAGTPRAPATPYLAHLLSVAALVIEDGGSEDEAIAGLLHDAVEDQGGATMAREIEERYGPAVARIVLECSDTQQTPKPPWLPRKQAYINHLPSVSPQGLRVSMADKVHNMRCTIADLRAGTPDAFAPFTGGREGTVWYYRALCDAYGRSNLPDGSRLMEEVERCVAKLEELTGVDGRTVDLSRLARPATAAQ